MEESDTTCINISNDNQSSLYSTSNKISSNTFPNEFNDFCDKGKTSLNKSSILINNNNQNININNNISIINYDTILLQNNQLKEKIENYEKEIENLKKQNEKYEKEKENLKKQKDELKKENDNLKKYNLDYFNQIENLKKQLTDVNNYSNYSFMKKRSSNTNSYSSIELNEEEKDEIENKKMKNLQKIDDNNIKKSTLSKSFFFNNNTKQEIDSKQIKQEEDDRKKYYRDLSRIEKLNFWKNYKLNKKDFPDEIIVQAFRENNFEPKKAYEFLINKSK